MLIVPYPIPSIKKVFCTSQTKTPSRLHRPSFISNLCKGKKILVNMFYGFKKESFTIVENTSLLKYDYSPATLKLNKGSPGSHFLLPFLSPLS